MCRLPLFNVTERFAMDLPDLNLVLEYKNLRVLKLYEQNYPKNILSAEVAFQEMLKYLWLTQKHAHDLEKKPDDYSLPSGCVMLRSMREIDEMWHEFILFTEDYTDFCTKYFGHYLHHLPNVFEYLPMPRAEEDAEIAKLLPYIYDQLGEQTTRTWFAAYLADEPPDSK